MSIERQRLAWRGRLGAWTLAGLGVLGLVVVIGLALWAIVEAPYDAAEVGAGLLLALGLLLLGLHLVAALLRRIGLVLPKQDAGADKQPKSSQVPEREQPAPVWYPERTFAKADRALEDGQLWRAKEILQGTLASQPYHAELYERYGRVLLRMGDLLNAGKYLFLSGQREAEYERPIALFLGRYAGKDPGQLIRAFPSRARRIERLPSTVIEELERKGWTPKSLREATRQQESPPPEWLWSATAVYVLVVVIAVLVAGVLVLVTGGIEFLDEFPEG